MQKVFLVGCPRSGTSWLQIILSQHAEIATVRETHLFDHYIMKIYEQFQKEAGEHSKDGLRVFMSMTELDLACRAFADRVFDRIGATKPQAKLILEKTASQIWCARVMRRIYPEAKFIHIVRDPRAVVASMIAFGKEDWGKADAPKDALSAAKVWRSALAIGHYELAKLPEICFELTYEDLSADPAATMARLYDWLGIEQVPYDAARFSIGAIKQRRAEGSPQEPNWENRDNFFRRGTADGWRQDLTAGDVAVIEAICGDVMAEFAYATGG